MGSERGSIDGLVSVVVLTVDRPGDLAACLESVRRQSYEAIETLVVINDADAGPFEGVRASFPEARFVVTGENLGCPGGRNRGAKDAQGEFVFFLDDDGVLEPDTVRTCVDFLKARRRYCAVGTAVVPGRPGAAASFDPARLGRVRRMYPNFSGGASCIRRDVFLELGGFNAGFRYGGEERELSLRMLRAGRLIAYLPDVRMIHMQRPSPLRDEAARLKSSLRNDLYFAWRYYPAPLAAAASAWKALYYVRFARAKGELGSLAPDLLGMPVSCLKLAFGNRDVAPLSLLWFAKALERRVVAPDDRLWLGIFAALNRTRDQVYARG